MNAQMGARPWSSHTQHDYARMLLVRGESTDRERALELIAGALTTYLELGMESWAERPQSWSERYRSRRRPGVEPNVRRMCSSVEASSSDVASRVASPCSQRRVAERLSAVQHSSA